jgi:hypothetical protein
MITRCYMPPDSRMGISPENSNKKGVSCQLVCIIKETCRGRSIRQWKFAFHFERQRRREEENLLSIGRRAQKLNSSCRGVSGRISAKYYVQIGEAIKVKRFNLRVVGCCIVIVSN